MLINFIQLKSYRKCDTHPVDIHHAYFVVVELLFFVGVVFTVCIWFALGIILIKKRVTQYLPECVLSVLDIPSLPEVEEPLFIH